jgi:hypothetical protein
MAIFVTSKKEKKILEGLGFEVHLESILGEADDERSSVPLPYVVSQLLSKKKADIERLKRENCDRCRALKAVSDNIYHADCDGCFNKQCGEPDRFYYDPDEEFPVDTAVEMREKLALGRFQTDFYRVYIPQCVKDLLDSYAHSFTKDLTNMLTEAVEFQTTQIVAEGMKEITIIGRVDHITSKNEMKKIDEVIEDFCTLFTLKYKNKFRIDYKNEKTVVGIYLMEKTLDDLKKEMKIKA